MLHILVYQNDKISIVFQRWLILVDIVGGYPCKPYHTTPNHAIPYSTEKGNKKIRSNFQNPLKYFLTQIRIPPLAQRLFPFECASRTWEILLTHITDQWAVVVGLFCSGSVFFGFGFGAYFSATHPPVSGAPSNVELRVVRQCDDEQLLLRNCRASVLSCSLVLLLFVFLWLVCVLAKMTDFHMNDILRSFRKMRMNRNLGQGNPQQNHRHHHHRPHQYQPINTVQHYTAQQSKLLKKIIKILKKSVIKQKVTDRKSVV